MLNIKDYLEKFSKNIQSSENNKKQITDIIEKQIQIKISQNNIEIKNYTIYTKTSPGVLNKIFINKNQILNKINLLIPSLKIIDIK